MSLHGEPFETKTVIALEHCCALSSVVEKKLLRQLFLIVSFDIMLLDTRTVVAVVWIERVRECAHYWKEDG